MILTKYSQLESKDREFYENYINQMTPEVYGENGPSFLEFIKSVSEVREQTKNLVFETLIIKDDKNIIGTASINIDDQGIKKELGLEGIFIGGVNINPDFRGLGFGKQIFQEIMNHILNNGYKGNIYLFSDNPIAIAMYEKHGFKIIKEIKNKYGTKENLMEKTI